MIATRRSAFVIAGWLGALLLCAVQIARTPFSADLGAFLPAHPDARQSLLIDQLQSGVAARTLLVAIDGGSAVERAAASRALAVRLTASRLFDLVGNGEADSWAETGHWIFEHRYQLSPAVGPGRFDAAGLADAFGETLSLLGTPAGNAFKPLLERDPTGETRRIAESLIPAAAPRSEGGVWVAHDGTRALLMARVRAPGADLDAQAAAIAALRESFAASAAPGLALQLSGAPLFSVDSRARIEHEVRWLAIACTALVGALLLLAFGSARALVLALLPVATGVVAGIAATSLAFGGVHGITLGFGSTLIGESVDYAIYYLVQARGGWRGWLDHGWPTLRLGLLTSVCGFAALVFSGFPGLAQLGMFSVAGLVAAALATRFVLPVLAPAGGHGTALLGAFGRLAAGGLARLPATRWAWVAFAVGALVLVVQRGDLWRADLASLSPVPREAIELDTRLRAELQPGDAGALVVVEGGDTETTLQRAEAVAMRLDTLVDTRRIAGYDSVTRLLPSLATQQRRLAALPDAATLKTALREATKTGPLAFDRLAPFVAEVEAARRLAPITPAAAGAGPAAALVDTLLVERRGGGAAALLPVQPVQPVQGAGGAIDAGALRGVVAEVPGAQLLEIKAELDHLYGRYLHEAQVQALLGAAGVVLLVAAALRSPPRLVAVCRPLVLAVLLTLGGLALAGVTLGILHLVGLLLVVAVGSNYALFFDLWRGETRPDDDTLASLLLANATTVLSFGLIAFSQIPALSAIGRVVAPGALLALVLAAAFVPRRRSAL